MSPATQLGLLWLASPALPVGSFSYSEGLEAAVEARLVADEAQAGDWLLDQLNLCVARSEMPLVAAAHAAWRAFDLPRLRVLDDWHRTTRESAEARQQAEQTGRSLAAWLKNGAQREDARVAALAGLASGWPVAFALAAVLIDAEARDALHAFAFGWAENMVQAAMKSVPLGQAAAQRMLARLAAEIPAAVERALALPQAEWQAFAPMLAIVSAQHETQYSRLFRS